jgi:hypothetical protein
MPRLATGLLAAAIAAPMAHTTEPNTPQECRVAATSSTTKTTAQHGFSSTTTTACRYDKAANKSTCTNLYEDTVGTKTKTVSVTTFASIADVIDEVKVNPPKRLSTKVETTGEGNRGPTDATLVYTYDDQRRLTKEAASSKNAPSYTTTYTAWDKSGRPTAGSTVFTKAPRTAIKIAYDEAARTVNTTTGVGSQWITCEMKFDVNGNAASTACKSPVGPASESTTTTTATENICR